MTQYSTRWPPRWAKQLEAAVFPQLGSLVRLPTVSLNMWGQGITEFSGRSVDSWNALLHHLAPITDPIVRRAAIVVSHRCHLLISFRQLDPVFVIGCVLVSLDSIRGMLSSRRIRGMLAFLHRSSGQVPGAADRARCLISRLVSSTGCAPPSVALLAKLTDRHHEVCSTWKLSGIACVMGRFQVEGSTNPGPYQIV